MILVFAVPGYKTAIRADLIVTMEHDKAGNVVTVTVVDRPLARFPGIDEDEFGDYLLAWSKALERMK